MTLLEPTLAQGLRAAADAHPEHAVTFFDGRGRRPERLTHRELLRAAGVTAARLTRIGVKAEDRVLVALPTSPAWCDLWLGALFAGAWPVATAPAPAFGSSELHAHRIASLAAQLDARVVVCTRATGSALVGRREVAGARVVAPEDLAALPAEEAAPAQADPRGTAFLQLTSGSTGRPRAVMISHGAVLHQVRALDALTGAPAGGAGHEVFRALVSWLPLHHDMGLNGGILWALLNGVDLWLYPPQAFLGRPHLWLRSLASHGAAIATAPNFGYQLCTERATDRDVADLDLSSWRAALTGAEMIRAETLDAFVDRFGPHGFDRRAFRPCYGLAEATLAVTLDRDGAGPRTRPLPADAQAGLGLHDLVSTGPPLPDTEVRIAAPDGSTLPDGAVGEVLVRGPGVFLGYFQDDEATSKSLARGWLRTGDLGFLADGELYLAGRLKDLLVLRGINVMPHEIEQLADSVAGGGGSRRAAAFSVATGPRGEEPVVVLEVEGDEAARARLAEAVRSRIGKALAFPVADVVFLRRGSIPRTTSGKVKRAELRQLYVEGRLARLGGRGAAVTIARGKGVEQ